MPDRNIRLLLEYDGSAYIGWQEQEGQRSIHGELRSAIRGVTGEDRMLTVAGRTDAGVHAVGQVANFHTDSDMLADKITPGLNHYLPNDISVHLAEDVPTDFSAKRDSLSKIYRYRVYRARQPAALERRAWHIRKPLDIDAMSAAAAPLHGEHDLNAFRSVHCEAPNAVREIFAIKIRSSSRLPVGEHVDIDLHANAFCRHMCRIIAGTLVEVGMGKRSVDSVAEALASRDRTRAGVTAPSSGLTLMRVVYPS